MKTAMMLALLAAAFFACFSVQAEAQAQTPGQVWRETRPTTNQKNVEGSDSACRQFRDKAKLFEMAQCLEKELVGVDVANVNARKQLIDDMDWMILSFMRHLNEYDHDVLTKLKPVVDKLVEIANRGGGGLTPEQIAELEGFQQTVNNRLEKLEADMKSTLRFAPALRLELSTSELDAVVAVTLCPAFQAPGGRYGFIACVGGGTTFTGRMVFSAGGDIWFAPVNSLAITLGGSYLAARESLEVRGSDWERVTFGPGVAWRPHQSFALQLWIGAGVFSERGLDASRWDRRPGQHLVLSLGVAARQPDRR